MLEIDDETDEDLMSVLIEQELPEVVWCAAYSWWHCGMPDVRMTSSCRAFICATPIACRVILFPEKTFI